MSWTFARMMELATGYWSSAALNAAVELGVFECLSERPRTASEVAGHLGLSPRTTADLLGVLRGLGLLEEEGGRYSIASGVARFLRADGECCLLDALRFNRDLYHVWGRLPDALRSGTAAVPPQAHLGEDAERTRRFVQGMHSRALAMMEAVVPVIRVPTQGVLLDLGSGPGTFSRRLAELHPSLRVTLFDLPAVLDIARELSRASPAADRLAYHAGDYRRDPLPHPVDAILFCGALHQETETSALDVFGRAREALRPGGTLTVIDLMLDADRSQPVFAALFSLNMKLFNPESGVFEVPRVAALLEKAGLRVDQTRALANLPYRAVTAIRGPADPLPHA
jgi:SAM-dependent methyltransferase